MTQKFYERHTPPCDLRDTKRGNDLERETLVLLFPKGPKFETTINSAMLRTKGPKRLEQNDFSSCLLTFFRKTLFKVNR